MIKLKDILTEKYEIDLEIGDTILRGKFKNKKVVVKEFGVDDKGQPTINGKKMLSFRIKKLMPPKEGINEIYPYDALKKIEKSKPGTMLKFGNEIWTKMGKPKNSWLCGKGPEKGVIADDTVVAQRIAKSKKSFKLEGKLTEAGTRRDPESIKKEYKNLKKQSISYLRREWRRLFRVGTPNQSDKETLVIDIIRAYHGDRYVDKAFEGKLNEAKKLPNGDTYLGKDNKGNHKIKSKGKVTLYNNEDMVLIYGKGWGHKLNEIAFQGKPIPMDTPNEFAYLDFKKFAYKKRGQYKKDMLKHVRKSDGQADSSKMFKTASSWWYKWAYHNNKAFTHIKDSLKFGRALIVMMVKDDLIFSKKAWKKNNKITNIK